MNHLAGMDYLGISIAVIMSCCAVYSIVGPVHSYALRKKAQRDQQQPALPEAASSSQPPA